MLLNVSKYSPVTRNNYALLKMMSHQETKKMDTTKTWILTRKSVSKRKFDWTSCPDKAKIPRKEAFLVARWRKFHFFHFCDFSNGRIGFPDFVGTKRQTDPKLRVGNFSNHYFVVFSNHSEYLWFHKAPVWSL